MKFEIVDMFWKLSLHIFYHNLRTSQGFDHFARVPAQKFGLLCKCYFPLKRNEMFLFFWIIDLLLLFPRDVGSVSPWTNPRKKSRALIFIFTFFTWLFSPLAIHMGPYGPVWTRMDPYIIIYCFYVIYTLLLHCFYMILDGFICVCLTLIDIFRKLVLHIYNHILRNCQGSCL